MNSDDRELVEIQLNFAGEPQTIRMGLPTQPVKPHRVLPVFQQMTNYLVGLSVKEIERQGGEISCREHCGACCRQPVPVSELEIYQIAELVDSMPEPRRSEVKQRFSDACEHFREMGWFERIAECGRSGNTLPLDAVKKNLKDLVDEYFLEGVACPFLEDESCSIHTDRPLVCREYLVTSPPEYCSRQGRAEVRRVNLFISPSKTVQFVGSTNRLRDVGFVPLIRALELAKQLPESFEEKRPAQWVGEFIDRLSGPKSASEPAIGRESISVEKRWKRRKKPGRSK